MQDTGPEQISQSSSNQDKPKSRVITASSFETNLEKYKGAVLMPKPSNIFDLAVTAEIEEWTNYEGPDPKRLQAYLDRKREP